MHIPTICTSKWPSAQCPRRCSVSPADRKVFCHCALQWLALERKQRINETNYKFIVSFLCVVWTVEAPGPHVFISEAHTQCRAIKNATSISSSAVGSLVAADTDTRTLALVQMTRDFCIGVWHVDRGRHKVSKCVIRKLKVNHENESNDAKRKIEKKACGHADQGRRRRRLVDHLRLCHIMNRDILFSSLCCRDAIIKYSLMETSTLPFWLRRERCLFLLDSCSTGRFLVRCR